MRKRLVSSCIRNKIGFGGVGAVIRLPLGVHRKSGGWYPFVANAVGELVPVGETVADCALWAAAHVERVTVPVVSLPLAHDGHDEGRNLPIFGESRASDDYPLTIREWCRTQDIEQVIGRYVTLDRRGVGSCPFKAHHAHGDRHPSFQVFGGANPHWYCYVWGRADDLFDFLCLYHGCSRQELWGRILHGDLL